MRGGDCSISSEALRLGLERVRTSSPVSAAPRPGGPVSQAGSDCLAWQVILVNMYWMFLVSLSLQ